MNSRYVIFRLESNVSMRFKRKQEIKSSKDIIALDREGPVLNTFDPDLKRFSMFSHSSCYTGHQGAL